MELYIRIMKYAFVHSNWTIEDDLQLPGSTMDNVASTSHSWAASLFWLEQLIKRRLWIPAKVFVKIVASVVPQDLALKMYGRLLQEMPSVTDSHPAVLFAHITTNTALSEYYGSKEIYDEAISTAEVAKNLLRQAASQSHEESCFPRGHIEHNFALAYLTKYTRTDTLQPLKEAAAIASHNHDLTSEDRALFEMLDQPQIKLNRFEAEKVLARLEYIEGDLQPDLPSLLFTKQKLLSITGHDNLGKLAEWFKIFEREHPTSSVIHQAETPVEPSNDGTFENPQALLYKAHGLSMIYMVLGDKQREEKARDEKESLEIHLPHRARIMLARDHFAAEWFGKTDRIFNVESGMRVLRQRIISAWKRGTLSLDEIKHIQPVRANTIDMQSGQELLDLVSTVTLREELYGSPLIEEKWQQRKNIIINWLRRDKYWTLSSSDLLIGALLHYRQLHHVDTEPNSRSYVLDQKQSIDAFNDFWETCNSREVQDIYHLVYLRNRLMSIQCDYNLFLFESPQWQSTQMLMDSRQQALRLLEDCNRPDIIAQGDFIASVHRWLGKIAMSLHSSMHFSSEAFGHFEKADTLHGRFRTEMSAIGGVDAQEIKKSWRETQFENDAVLTEAIDHAKMDWMRTGAWGMGKRQDWLLENMWNWVQKSKGRAIAEAVALSTELPKMMVEKAAKKDKDNILRAWQDCRKAIYNVPADGPRMRERYEKRQELAELESRMAAIPELDDIVALVNGRATTMANMQALLSEFPEDERSQIVLIDWFIAWTVDGRDLHLIVLRDKGPPAFQRVEKGSKQKAEDWIQKYLAGGQEPNHFENACKDAQEASGLVKPLATLTKPGEMLVFCPTLILHRFPLHCLSIEDQPAAAPQGVIRPNRLLLQRNTIVYVHSMTLLRLCIQSRIQKDSPSQTKAVIATPLEDCLDSVTPIAHLFRETPLQADDVSLSNLTAECANSYFLHFCGHVHASEPDRPLDAHLLLFEEDTDGKKAECIGNHLIESKLSGTDIMQKMNFMEGAHVNLISCGSGVTYESAGDDMLGLVPSFFYAGARSVLGTLWPISTYYAEKWTEFFTRSLILAKERSALGKEETSGGDRTFSEFINLARCCQEASIALMEQRGERNLRDWGPYVFQGFWGMKLVI